MHVVLDLGGVLLRWRPAEIVRRALPHRAADAEPLARSVFAHPDGEWSRFDRGLATPDEVASGLATRLGLNADEVAAVMAEVPAELVPLPDTVDLLARLRTTGRPLFFLSNMPGPEADRLERENEFFSWFTDGVFSARVGLAKPDRRIFDLAAERFGVPAAELLFLDDHVPNVEAARAAGWQAEVFTDAAACEADLVDRGVLPGSPGRGPTDQRVTGVSSASGSG